MRLVIYGAQAIALGAYKSIKTVVPNIEIECFLVTSMGDNASVLGGIPVRELAEFVSGMTQAEKEEIEVLIGTPENVMSAIEASLEEVGLSNYVRLTSIRWADMQRDAFLKSGEFLPLSALPVGCHRAELNVYKMSHYKDKALSTEWAEPLYVKKLQVGAALTSERVSELTDADGENISAKNANYSELTGLYWMWKNVMNKADSKCYFGLAHYRRLFDFSEDDILRLTDHDIDVVLPYPMPYEPNIHAHHKRWIKDADWEALLIALDELQPEYAKKMSDIFEQGYFYNYNIMLAKRDVLAEYCAWLFPILERTEELSVPKGSERHDRYIGYIGENLTTLYFMYNKDKLNIAHASCRFLT